MARRFYLYFWTMFWMLPFCTIAQKVSFQIPEYQFKNAVLQQQLAKAIDNLCKSPYDNFDLAYLMAPDTIWTRDSWTIQEHLFNLLLVTHNTSYYPERDLDCRNWIVGCCLIGKHTLYLYDTVTVNQLFTTLNRKYTVSYDNGGIFIPGLEDPFLFFWDKESLRQISTRPWDYCYDLFVQKRDFNNPALFHLPFEAVDTNTMYDSDGGERSDIAAQFPDNGDDGFREWMKQNLHFPHCDTIPLSAGLHIYLTIERDGRISDVRLRNLKYEDCYLEELRRVTAIAPLFYPAVKRGHFVRSRAQLWLR